MTDKSYEEGKKMQGAFWGIIVSAMAPGAGAIPVLFLKQVSTRVKDVLLGYASGIMIAATTFGLSP